ncbi:rho GTPase-activating protein 20 isoform X1 [Pelobates fuscus]|uniref:rho GTPase-activating protein 20 isoform X1 n=1 Tax=Pelobates fuscus TaxID=191477 RepID=UPI002FE4B8DF
MEEMSPQQDNVGQTRSSSLTGDLKITGVTENKKKMKSLAQRRQSAPSLVLSKALNKSRTITKETCFSPISPETCPLVQTFICPSRAFIMHSPVQLKTGLQTQDRHLFLFTDIMIVAKSKSPSHYKLKHHVRVSEMWTASCMEEVCEGSTNPERSFVFGWPITNCVATFGTPEEKEKWLSLIQRRIKEEKESDHPKTIPVKIITKDIGNCAYSKILTVTTDDTVTDVVKMALQQFGVEGCHTDYQLWVTSGKDDSPYPLIGHEYPYAIKMSHIRDALPHIQASKDTVCPLNLELPFLMEQLPREMQCQFILKPSRLALGHQLADPNQKPFKRKRSIINWTFWRGSNTQLDNLPLSPTSPAPGKLFGLSLPVICENDNLPKPVMDMLSVLCQDGPCTRGIFRRSANAKSCKEIKERLNSGYDVNFACESIFVIASVFKDFLRNIPGSIFSSRLYDKWVSVMDQGAEQEKIKAIKRLLEKLPRVNVMLLRYLFGVLHCIEQHSDTNQMTAFNLAVCIAPSLLWLPSPTSAEVESEFTRKVSTLVQFLIENCCPIFGDDLSVLYANLSDKDDKREDSSDLCSFKHIDSSYDSLENELNDADSPFGGLIKKLSHDNRSRDSVLTLSDCDLDHPDIEENQGEHRQGSHPIQISKAFHHKSVPREQSENESHCSNSSGFSSAMLSDVRRYRRSSEPAIGILVSRFSQLNQSPKDNAAHNTSCDALLSQSADDYLKQHRYLQVEGQKLIDRSLTLGIDVTKSISKTQTVDKKSSPDRLLPPTGLRLNICSRTSCSSLSSPGTSPSGSSLSSLDSAFSQFSDYSILTPNDTTSPSECTVRSYKTQIELSPDYMSDNSFSGFMSNEISKQSCYNTISEKDKFERPCYKTPVSIQPGSWLRKGTYTGKNFASRKAEKSVSHLDRNKRKTTEENQSNMSNISKISIIHNPITVPKGDCEANHHIIVQSHYDNTKDTQLSSSPPFNDETSDRKLSTRHLTVDRTVDKNGNGENEVECSSFLLSSPVSINIEVSSPNQEKTPLPQTFVFSQNIALLGQTDRRKSTNSCSVEESPSLYSSPKCSNEQNFDVESHCRRKDNATKTTIGREISIRVASFKKNKVLPCNIDTEITVPNCELEKNFCISPKLTNTQECDAVIQNSRDCYAKRCSDPKFEDADQRFFAEESYV